MAFLKVIFPHMRNGKFLSSATYYEVADERVEALLGVDPELGVKLFCLETSSWKAPVKAPQDFFEEANKAVEEARQKIVEADMAEEAAKTEAAAEPEEAAAPAEEPAAEAEEPAAEEAPRSKRKRAAE